VPWPEYTRRGGGFGPAHELGHPESSIAPRWAFAALPHFKMRTSAHAIFVLILQRQIALGYHPIIPRLTRRLSR
jgi:hypothetical protein